MKLPREIEIILQRLDKVGEAYVVGGCVRDHLLGKTPNDYDITTNLLPDEIEAQFPDYRKFTIGKRFGTIGILTDIGTVEITTYRKDGIYEDHRKPVDVSFTPDIVEDLRRRDFTVNAMAYNPQIGLVDPFNGLEDLDSGILKAVGDPKRRLNEDGLRILRAIRFTTQLDFTMDKALYDAVVECMPLIEHLSVERIRDEVCKILLQDRPSRGIYLLLETGALAYIFPELMDTVDFDQMTPYHDKTLFDHIVCVVDHVPAKLPLRLAALFHDIEKPDTLSIDEETGRGHFFGHDTEGAVTAAKILRRYHHSKAEIEQVGTLIREHMKVHEVMTDRALRRQINRVGEDLILDLYDLMLADMHCTVPDRDQTFLIKRKERIAELLQGGLVQEEDIAIDGNDLIALGMKEGPKLGKVLNGLKDLARENPELNDRKKLLEIAKKRIQN